MDVEDPLVQNAFEELPAHIIFQCQRASHKMISPKWPRLKLTEETASTHLRPCVANHAFIAEESVGIDLAATSALRLYLTFLVMAFGETRRNRVFAWTCHPRLDT